MISNRIVLSCAQFIYDRKLKEEATKLTFAPAVNREEKLNEYKIVEFYYPEQFKKEKYDEDAWKYDYSVMVLEEDLGDKHSWIGIDARTENSRGV